MNNIGSVVACCVALAAAPLRADSVTRANHGATPAQRTGPAAAAEQVGLVGNEPLDLRRLLAYERRLDETRAEVDRVLSATKEERLALAEAGSAIAARMIGLWSIRGTLGYPLDLTVGRHWLSRAAGAGDRISFNELLQSYAHERPPDFKSLCAYASWLDEAGRPVPNGRSKYYLAECYLRGIGAERSVSRGIALLMEAAERHRHEGAAVQLASIYEEGQFGLPPNIDTAVYWQQRRSENARYFELMMVCFGPLEKRASAGDFCGSEIYWEIFSDWSSTPAP